MLLYHWVVVLCMADEYTRPFVRKEDYRELVRRFGGEFTRNPPRGVLVRRALDEIVALESRVLELETSLALVDGDKVGRAEEIICSTAELDVVLSRLRMAYGM